MNAWSQRLQMANRLTDRKQLGADNERLVTMLVNGKPFDRPETARCGQSTLANGKPFDKPKQLDADNDRLVTTRMA